MVTARWFNLKHILYQLLDNRPLKSDPSRASKAVAHLTKPKVGLSSLALDKWGHWKNSVHRYHVFCYPRSRLLFWQIHTYFSVFRAHISNTGPRQACLVALTPGFSFGTLRNSILPPPALSLHSPLSSVNTEFCSAAPGSNRSPHELTTGHGRDRDRERDRERSTYKARQRRLHRQVLELGQVGKSRDAKKLWGVGVAHCA